MTPELEQKLFKKYPLIFRQKDLPMTQTCMCWGIDCGDGWYNIIDTLCAQIQHHLNWKNCEGKYEYRRKHEPPPPDAEEGSWVVVPQVEAVQVKEKYGGMRFYYTGGDDYIQGAVDIAESLSMRTCETCGNPGRQTTSGWILTLCPAHAAEKKRELEDDSADEEEQ